MLIDEYRLLSADNYHLQFTEVEVYGFGSSQTVAYRGKGAIDRGGDSRLKIMIWSSPNIAFEQERAEIAKNMQQGQVIAEQLSCRLWAKDQLGRVWNDCKIFITDIENDGQNTLIKADVDEFILKTPNDLDDRDQEYKIEIMAIHKGFLPLRMIPGEEGGSWRRELSFEVSDFRIMISKDIPVTKVVLTSKNEIDPLRMQLLFEAISIASGKIFYPLMISWADQQDCFLKICHGQQDQDHLEPLLDVLCEYTIDNLSQFVSCYLSEFTDPYGPTYAAWHRAYLASSAGIEISSLALCTAIEGIVKYRFTYPVPISPEADSQIVNARDSVKEINSPDWIIESMLKHLDRIRESKPTIKKSLKEIAKISEITNKQLARWESLRNKIAHFDLLDDSPKENEKILRDYETCLTIFFKLVAQSAKFSWLATHHVES